MHINDVSFSLLPRNPAISNLALFCVFDFFFFNPESNLVLPVGMFTGRVGNHGCNESVSAVARGCLADSISQHPSSCPLPLSSTHP